MDNDFLKKEKTLLKIRAEANRWLDRELQAEAFTDFHGGWVARLERDIGSDKFVHDHESYVKTLGELQAHKRALEAITTAQDRADKASTELKALTDERGEGEAEDGA